MASTVMQDPRSTQARSAWIAGLTEACAKITNILNMGTSHLEDLQLVEERPTEDDKCRIYIAPLGSKLWLQSPEPVVKLDGNIITKDYYGYSIDYLGGSIIFEDELNRPAEGAKITVTVDYINTDSYAMTGILDKLKELEEKAAKNYKGYYGTAADLEAADVAGVPGDYVIIEDVNEIWVWNDKDKKFVSTYKVPDLSPYYTKVETDDLLEQKEDFIREHGDTNASDTFYWGGRKTWVDLYQKVRETALSGVVFTDETKILETDTILTALGKLQGQINAKIHDILGTGEPTDATEGRVGQEYINTSNGDKYHLTTITTDGKYIWEKYANVSGVLNVPGGATAKLTGDFGSPPYEFEFSEDTDTHVNSFNGRTGAVTPESGDYTADMVGALGEEDTAVAASKLETPRTLQVDLSYLGQRTFDGSKDVLLGVTGVLPVANGGTSVSNLSELRYMMTGNTEINPAMIDVLKGEFTLNSSNGYAYRIKIPGQTSGFSLAPFIIFTVNVFSSTTDSNDLKIDVFNQDEATSTVTSATAGTSYSGIAYQYRSGYRLSFSSEKYNIGSGIVVTSTKNARGNYIITRIGALY